MKRKLNKRRKKKHNRYEAKLKDRKASKERRKIPGKESERAEEVAATADCSECEHHRSKLHTQPLMQVTQNEEDERRRVVRSC